VFEHAGLVRKQEGKASFGVVKRGLRLLVDDIDDKDPSDIAYVFSGYAPLSIRLVEAAVKGAGLPEDVLKTLPGPSFDVEQASQDEPGQPRPPSSTSPGGQPRHRVRACVCARARARVCVCE
jgi:vacuolar protein sorting-associated protein 33A